MITHKVENKFILYDIRKFVLPHNQLPLTEKQM